MKRSWTVLFFVLALALVQIACHLPSVSSSGGSTLGTAIPLVVNVVTVTPYPDPSPTNTHTVPTATTTTTPTAANAGNTSHRGGACTYQATFIGDATIPDDTPVAAGSTFVKTWMVRNDGNCTWRSNGYDLTFTGGSQMGAPAVIPLRSNVAPGETIDVSVTFTAPALPGTYMSNWILRVDNDPNGDQPLYARIQVNGGLQRLQFQPGTTSAVVTGKLEANETHGYLLAAQQGQVIIAGTSLSDWQDGVRVKITTSDNVALPDLVDNLDVVTSLPATEDYRVWVSGGSHATTYHLAVTVPIRITFDPGAVSASEDGTIRNGMAIWYVLHASTGQTLTASLDGSNAGLIIAGLENPQVLTASASDKTITSWTGTLPTTQDYIIQVMPLVDSITYTLKVTVQ